MLAITDKKVEEISMRLSDALTCGSWIALLSVVDFVRADLIVPCVMAA